jgi:hypothetical protein
MVTDDATVTPGVYRHFKGGIYTVIGVATDTETEEQVVVYQSENGRLWTRPIAMFTETVDRDGYIGPRFRPFIDGDEHD